MMLSEEIKQAWEGTPIGYTTPIKSLKNTEYPAWAIRMKEGFGVAIPYKNTPIVDENFAGVNLFSGQMNTQDKLRNVLILLTEMDEDIINPFAALSAEFIQPGNNGELREKIINNPDLWWGQWKELLGNKNIDERVYDNLGEMVVLRYLLQQGLKPVWRGPDRATYDIDCGDVFYEVKSTQKREARQITLNNSFQLSPPDGKHLYIILCQFERSETGDTINSVLEDLVELGYGRTELEKKLKKVGLEVGKSARNRAYVLHAMIKYPVDGNFPCIKDESFVGGKMPKNIISISYTVSLDGIDGNKII